MTKTLRSLFKDESGATAIEYGLIAALVGVALIGGLQALEGGLTGLFESIRDTLGGSAGSGGTTP